MRTKVVMTALLAACGSATSPSSAPTATAAAPPDAAEVAAPVVDAPPAPPVIEPALAAAPASVFRYYSTGLVVEKGGARLESWTLRTHEGRGLVSVHYMTWSGDTWADGATTQYVGTATTSGDATILELAAGTLKLSLVCSTGQLDVAAATAIRTPVTPIAKRKHGRECVGDPGTWKPAKQTKVAVLACKHPDFESPMIFGAAPGVEYLYVNDDCNMQGGGYRAIAPDGAITPVR